MRVFVTGATGVLGTRVVKRLVASGVEVRALSRSDLNTLTVRGMGAEPAPADLFDVESLRSQVKDCDAVLHLATRIPSPHQMRRAGAWSENDRIRRDGTAALIEAALKSGRVETFVYPSVCMVYADGGSTWLSVESARLATVPALASTLEAEAQVRRFAASAPDRRGVSLRFGTFYGPGTRDSRDAVAMATRGLILPLAPQEAYRSLIWTEDAAAAVIATLDRAPSGVYDVVEDDPFTQAQAATALAEAVGRRRLRSLPRVLLRLFLQPDMRTLLARSQRVSAARFRKDTGWRPTVPDQRAGWQRIASALGHAG